MELDLDLLKKDWNKNDFKKYSQEELFQMTKKKSVSVAKWVFIIGILEILFWQLFNFGLEKYLGEEEEPTYPQYIGYFLDVMSMFSEALPFVFVAFLLYLNYKIRTEDTPKKLMRNILLMKKSIHWYIRIFLAEIILVFVVATGVGFYEEITNDEFPNFSMAKKIFMLLWSSAIFFLFMAGLSTTVVLVLKWIYKKLVYGRMLKQLKENYDELSKMEE